MARRAHSLAATTKASPGVRGVPQAAPSWGASPRSPGSAVCLWRHIRETEWGQGPRLKPKMAENRAQGPSRL